MSSVTRLHVLSQSMLNVSCQKQTRCSSLPTNSLAESPMESVGQPRLSGACSLLGVPGLSTLDVDDDEGEFVIGIRPKSSPLPRRRSSFSDDDSEPEPPLCGSRRVSFADAKGLSLVQVKEFDTWDIPKLPGYDPSEGEGKDAEEYFLSLHFCLPLTTEELVSKVQEQKVELETIELLPGTTILKGIIRVLNISYSKAVYIRTTLDNWSSHFDLLAEYIPGSSDGLMDCFSFKLTLVPPFGEEGAKVDFCLRYETPIGMFWANNYNRNYVLFCHQRAKEKKETTQNVNKKSCLKTVSQNFSTVEDISAMEASSNENISKDVSKHGGKEDTKKVDQITEGQPGTSEEDGQKLVIENRRNCSRRNRRKAARMARVRDHFAQRGDTERDESPPQAKQAAREETLEEKRADIQTSYEGNRKPEGPHFVSESLESRSKPLSGVLHDTSPAHDFLSITEPKKSESVSLADSATLTTGKSAADTPDKPLHSDDEPAPAECQNVNKPVCKTEEASQKQGMSYEPTSSIAAETADSIISAVSSNSLVSETNSFTFGNVVAPLYHQVFVRMGGESQSLDDLGNSARSTVNVVDLTQSYPHIEGRETSCTLPPGARYNNDEVQKNVTNAQMSNQECLEASHPIEEESQTTNDIRDLTETQHDPAEITHSDQIRTNTSDDPETISEDAAVHSHSVSISNTDVFSPQIPSESSHPSGEAQGGDITHDLESQITAETAQAPLSEHTCTHIQTNLDETQEVVTCPETSFMSVQPSSSVAESFSGETDHQSSASGVNNSKCLDESNTNNDVVVTVSVSANEAISADDKPLDDLHDLNLNHINNSAKKEPENKMDEDVTTLQISSETQEETNNVEEDNKVVNNTNADETQHPAQIKAIGEAAESMTKARMSDYHIHDDMFVELKDEETFKDEARIISDKVEHCETEAVVSKQEDFCFTESTEVKNWEMMVEEEEKNILTDEEESQVISVEAEDVEAVEKDKVGQVEDGGTETVLESSDRTETDRDKTVEDMLVNTTVTDKKNKIEDTDVFDNKQKIRGDEIGKIVTREDREVRKEYDQVTKTEETDEEREPAEENEAEEREEAELEKQELSAEIQESNTERSNVQEKEEIQEEEEIEMDMNEEDEAGVEWDNLVKQESVGEENQEYKKEILVHETGESESVALEDRENKVGHLSARVNNVQDRRAAEKESACILTEMHLYKEACFQSENGTRDLSKALRGDDESSAAEEGSCIPADEPESDQTSQDSASGESDSDDEVELYMHCFRAVHAGAQAHKDGNKDSGFSLGKRPSVSRSKLLSTPMPSISESLDEEQHLSHPQDSQDGARAADVRPAAAALPDPSGQESIKRRVSWWKETFSCSSISKTLLYATLFVVFLVVAYYYDFIACFGLYLISVVWLCCQGERQPVKNNNRID